jgi:RNA polymerase sigma factor (sigma-70 family)
MHDNELLEAIARQSETAFRQFYDRYNRLLYKWAYTRTGNAELTEECLQRFWITVWLAPGKIKTDDQGSAKNFLLHHFTYRLLNYIKSIVLNESDKVKSCSLHEVADSLPYNHIEEALNARELSAVVTLLLRELPDSVWEAFRLYWLEGYSAKEVAQELNIAERNALDKIKGSLRFVRKHVGALYPVNL